MSQTTLQSPAGHEPDQVASRAILACVAGLVVLIAVVSLVVLWLLPSTHPALLDPSQVAPTPAMRNWGQGGRDELARLRRREEANLETYQWLDERRTRARIPIRRAMELLVRRSGSSPQPARPAEGGSP